jgi:formylglycine-generating enzyme required for sulfatase activity
LHSNGLVHRDVKPSNVMILRNGAVKLIDYGLTRSLEPEPGRQTKIEGTLGYMAPEQARPGGHVDVRSDIYSAGRVLQYLLRNLPESSEGLQKPEQIRKLETIAARMTEPDPKDRYADIAEVQQKLESTDSPPDGNGRRKAFMGLASMAVISVLGTLSITWEYLSGIEGSTSAANLPSKSPPLVVRPPFRLSMVEIPAGTFRMGGTPGDKELRPNESPQRTVTFATPFRMSSCEITVGQFREFVLSTGYLTEAERSGEGGWKASPATSWGEQRAQYVWSSPGYTVSELFPVTIVTYADAMAFCEWLSRSEGKLYRLPTEAEWEYACRAGTTTPNHFPPGTRDSYCWSFFNIKRTAFPRPAATREPNAWGLYDMCGNVREWCLDWYAEDAYRLPYAKFPNGPPKGTMRVVRGGCFMDMDPFMRSSHRGYVVPTQAMNNQGFRVVQAD